MLKGKMTAYKPDAARVELRLKLFRRHFGRRQQIRVGFRVFNAPTLHFVQSARNVLLELRAQAVQLQTTGPLKPDAAKAEAVVIQMPADSAIVKMEALAREKTDFMGYFLT